MPNTKLALAAQALHDRLGLAPLATLALAETMDEATLDQVLAANASKQRPDLAVQAVLDKHADTLRPPVETEVPQVLRKDGTWGDLTGLAYTPAEINAADFGVRVSPEIPPLEQG